MNDLGINTVIRLIFFFYHWITVEYEYSLIRCEYRLKCVNLKDLFSIKRLEKLFINQPYDL